ALDPAIGFKSLGISELMKETFSYRESHNLYRACLVKPVKWPRSHADLGPTPRYCTLILRGVRTSSSIS
ncbi:hypothetical protein HZ326_16725, partial [Fusarium oxysporum f. sp. albedinis]